MTKIIYFDIDGTLRSEMNKVSPKTKYAIEQCSKKGIICVICTGRNPGSIQEDIKELLMSGIISGGGCFVKYKNKILSEEYFQRDIVKKIIDVCFENKIAVSLESKTNIYMNKPAAEFYKMILQKKSNIIICSFRMKFIRIIRYVFRIICRRLKKKIRIYIKYV